MTRRYHVIVIGGGQAGLAIGRLLAVQGLDFLILDAGARTGDSWRARWNSLRLFTPARYSALPGLRFPADDEHMPHRDEMADYLALYARTFDLPIHHGEHVHTVRECAGGGFIVGTSLRSYEAEQVVIATGPFQRAAIPPVAASLDVPQLHSSAYRQPAQLPDGPVLVVGGANSGVQIAQELAASRTTWLAVGEKCARLPERLMGRSIFWWLDRAGALDATAGSARGRMMRRRNLLIGNSPSMIARSAGVRVTRRVTGVEGSMVTVQDGRRLEVASVVWATGFRSDYPFLHVPVIDAEGRPMHRRGVTRVPGLYFLGLQWQHTRGSALVGWVGRDAAFIAARIADAGRRANSVYAWQDCSGRW